MPDRSLSKSLAALHSALAQDPTDLPSFGRSCYEREWRSDDDAFMAALAPQDRSSPRCTTPASPSFTALTSIGNDFTASRTTATDC